MRIFIPACAALALAACSDRAPQPQPTTSPGTAASTPTPSTTPEQQALIPARFRGVWDYVDGTCDPASDLRIDIQGNAITFYEAYGKVTGVRTESPDSVVVELAMEGEGETWTMQRRFTLSDNGQRLTPSSADGDDFEPMPLKKCEG